MYGFLYGARLRKLRRILKAKRLRYKLEKNLRYGKKSRPLYISRRRFRLRRCKIKSYIMNMHKYKRRRPFKVKCFYIRTSKRKYKRISLFKRKLLSCYFLK
jgi:hypothetical protein